MPLIIAPLNQTMKIIKVLTDEKTKRHLESLGILKDEEIIVLSQSQGDVIIKIRDGRLALNKDTALKIHVA